MQVYRPATREVLDECLAPFQAFYNERRPNQALSCGNRPPRQAFPVLPTLRPLPAQVDPDAWLQTLHQKRFRRRVTRSGTVTVDKATYYLGRAYRDRYVVLVVDSPNRQFQVELDNQPLKTLPLKGLQNRHLALEDYLTWIARQAYSEWRQRQAGLRRIAYRAAAA
jgi:hypothetical protein